MKGEATPHPAAGGRGRPVGPVLVTAEQLRRRVPGGIGRYATGLLSGLGRLGVEDVAVLASRHVGRGRDPLATTGFPLRSSHLPGVLLTRAWDAGLVTAPRGAGVVHAVALAFPSVRPAHSRGGPALVVTVHDLAWRAHPASTTPRGRRWHETALRRALRHADGFVVPSRAVADALVDAGAPGSRVRVVGHGVDHLPPPDQAGAAALLGRLGVGEGYLLAAGTLEPRKNLGRLAAAYARARPYLPEPWPLVVVGPAGWGSGGRDRGGDGPAAVPGVLAAGEVTDGVLAALYAGARAFAYVPLAEGFGFPPVEAMACGTPVVTGTGVPSAEPGPGLDAPALRVDPLDVDEISAALVRASADEALRTELVARGAAAVRALTWERSAREHFDWWGELA